TTVAKPLMAPSETPHIPSDRPAIPATPLVRTLIHSLLKSPWGALPPPEHLSKAEVRPARPAHWPSGDARPLPSSPCLPFSSPASRRPRDPVMASTSQLT
ncbi:unnamed protein product, partial [Rangifer tarandus platyrhynchus]